MAKGEAAFHAKIKMMHFKACCYEERIDEDPGSASFLQRELDILKKSIWEYHMREEFPAPPAPISTEPIPERSGWMLEEPTQICVGYLMLFIFLALPFILKH
jgi:hypothetical protein